MKEILYSITGKLFRKYKKSKTKNKLVNKNFTLITNNCLGGVIYHDLDIKFNSPTINLYFSDNDFLKFTKKIEYYLKQDVVERKNGIGHKGYPIGVLDDIEIHFLHYSSFDEAKKKWNERSSRVKYDNIFIIMTDTEGTYLDLIKEFEQVPYKHKVLFSKSPILDNNKYGFYIKGFEQKKGLGILWDYQNLFGKKYYEQFDLINWLNKEPVKDTKK